MRNDMDLVLVEAMLYSMEGKDPSQAILNQEARGQMDVVRNQRLPKKINRFGASFDHTKMQYENMGLVIEDSRDDLFWNVTLPDGWKIKATDHFMWNELLDDKGRKRASFFYKAAFYDRDAFINFECRYGYKISPFDNYESDATYEERRIKPWTVYITDCGESILELGSLTASTMEEKWQNDDKLIDLAKEYLNEHYPNWKNVNAYWD